MLDISLYSRRFLRLSLFFFSVYFLDWLIYSVCLHIYWFSYIISIEFYFLVVTVFFSSKISIWSFFISSICKAFNLFGYFKHNYNCPLEHFYARVLSHFSCVRLFVTLCRLLCPWGFSRQDYWGGLPFPSPGDLPDPGIESVSLVLPVLQADSLPLSHWESPRAFLWWLLKNPCQITLTSVLSRYWHLLTLSHSCWDFPGSYLVWWVNFSFILDILSIMRLLMLFKSSVLAGCLIRTWQEWQSRLPFSLCWQCWGWDCSFP